MQIAMKQAEVYVLEETDEIEIMEFIGLVQSFIAGIFMTESYQSSGAGKRLLDYAKSIKSELSLQVYEKNYHAVKFYQREGFTVWGEEMDTQTGEKEFLLQWKK